MKTILIGLIASSSCIYSNLSAQVNTYKPIVDTAAENHWQAVNTAKISNNGKYLGYITADGYGGSTLLTLKSVFDNWHLELNEIDSYEFSCDNHTVITLDHTNNLKIIQLGANNPENIKGVKLYSLFNKNSIDWLVYLSDTDELTLRNMKNGRKYVYIDVLKWYSDKNFNTIVLITKNSAGQSLSYINLSTLEQIKIAEYKSIENFVIDEFGTQIAFLSETGSFKADDRVLWHCTLKSGACKIIATNETISVEDKELYLTGINRFNREGTALFLLFVNKRDALKKRENIVKIWSYKDVRLQSELDKKTEVKPLLAILNMGTRKFYQIQRKNEFFHFPSSTNDNIINIEYAEGNIVEGHWNAKGQRQYYIYNCNTNLRTKINLFAATISPNSKFIVGYDSSGKNMVFYDVAKNETYNLTKNLKKSYDDQSVAYYDMETWLLGGWTTDDEVILYDQYDIWKFNLKKMTDPINLTNNYGRKHEISFSILNNSEERFSKSTKHLLIAFDHKTKQNGFYRLSGLKINDPEKLIMSDYLYTPPKQIEPFGFTPIKSKHSNIWMVSRQAANTSPNYFITSDFKTYKQVSFVYPEQKYNWLYAELINFKTIDGKANKAILYKPKNFDSSKRYPVIIHYYDKMTNHLNLFLKPGLTYGAINIPWFVSRGYLVCTPDIIYTRANLGDNIVNSVVGMAKHVSMLPFVDSMRMGIQGHSFGGYETNLLVTRTNCFAAAMASSGYADLVSRVGSVTPNGGDNYYDYWAILGQGRLGYSIWQRLDLYTNYSPLLSADKVTTPLLMMNNENDGIVNVSQGKEFFIALRMLGKKVWMLQYENGKHTLYDNAEKFDYTTKIEQFFGHYLKNQPMPDWMQGTNN